MRIAAHAPATPVPALPELEDREGPGQRILRRAVFFGLGGLGLLVVLALTIILATQGSTSPAKPVPPPTTASTGPAAAPGAEPSPTLEIPTAAPTKSAKPLPPAVPLDAGAIGRELAAAAAGVQLDPESALRRLEGAIGALSAGWPSLPRDRQIAAQDSILEFIYRAAGSTELSDHAVATVADGARSARAYPVAPARILPAVWSAGMLVRLAREKDIPASARAALDDALGTALGPVRPSGEQSFEAGASAMVHALPGRLIPGASGSEVDPESWARWAETADGVAGPDAAARARLLLAGLETLLVSGPEPNQSRSCAGVVADLVGRITWREGDESRRFLLRWFADRRISAPDLYAVTSALATRSSAEGVDLTMVLSTSASERVRAELRDRYATLWGVQDQTARDDLVDTWAKAARAAVERSLSAATDLEQLEQAAVLARLCEAAWWQWRGDGAEAAAIVADLRGPIDATRTAAPSSPPRPESNATDGGWGEKYLAARQNIKTRRDLLEQMKAVQADPGPVDAEVIAGEAIGASTTEVRSAAADLVRQYAGAPAMINALLERLPRMPRAAHSASLIESVCLRQLPPLRDPEWPTAARRALVERLLEAKAAQSPLARADRLADLLAVSYRSMASPAPLATDQREQHPQPPAHASVAQVWLAWRSAADKLVPVGAPPVRLDDVERRRAGRLGLARGSVQAFAAEEASLCELMGYVIGAERPGRTEEARTILAQLAEDRRHAEGILDQLRSTERAMVQLWLIRLGPEPQEPPA